jgi:uncharacterized surface protein with fasciclin (FAS1) repeats
VFAPTNAAFAKLDGLLADQDADAVTRVLLYHVVAGAVPAAQIVTRTAATTLQGSDISITVGNDGSVLLNDVALVTMTDIAASNGVVHLIDTVLMPATVPATDALPRPPPLPPLQKIGDLVFTTPELSTLATALASTGLVQVLNAAGPFTLFAPTK